jgi:hypothetical protein
MRAAANIGDKRIATKSEGNNSKNDLNREVFSCHEILLLRSIKVPFCDIHLPIPARI